jgi:hypothetical protein
MLNTIQVYYTAKSQAPGVVGTGVPA